MTKLPLFAGSPICLSRIACRDCVGNDIASQVFRSTLAAQYEMPASCPYGVTDEALGIERRVVTEEQVRQEQERVSLLAEEQGREPKMAICRKCEAAKIHKVLGVELVWCGSPLRAAKDGSTCGCLMNVKTIFELPCPQGKF